MPRRTAGNPEGRGHRPGRAAALLGLSALLVVSGLTAASAPAVAGSASPAEITIPAAPQVTPRWQRLYAVGTGVQMSDHVTGQLRWQSLADGRVAHREVCGPDLAFSGDTVGCVDSRYQRSAYDLHDFASGTTVRVPLPEGHRWGRAHGSGRVLTYAVPADGSGPLTLHLLGVDASAPADTLVRLPGTVGAPEVLDFDEKGAVLSYYDGTSPAYGLLDFATAELTALPPHPDGPAHLDAALSRDHVVVYDASRPAKVHLVSRSDRTTSRQVVLARPESSWSGSVDGEVRVLGDWLLTGFGDSSRADGPALQATPINGGSPRTVLAGARRDLALDPSGALYAVGGADSSRWGIQRIMLDSAGVPVAQRVVETPPVPAARSSLSLAHGRLAFLHNDGRAPATHGYDVPLAGPSVALTAPAWSCSLHGAVLCQNPGDPAVDWADQWPHATGDGRLVALSAADGVNCQSCATVIHVRDAKPDGATRTVRVQSATALKPSRIISASGRYLLFSGSENSRYRQVVADIETGKVLRSSAGLSALWGTTLWTADPTSGAVSGVDVVTGAVTGPVDLKTGCRPYTLDVVGDWIFTTCPYGSTGHAYNQVTRTSVPLPFASTEWEVGDGFVVMQVNSGLTLVDVRSGAPVTRQIADYPAYTGPGPNWAVDRFGGGVAYTGRDGVVHVVAVASDAGPLAATDAAVGTTVGGPAGAPWTARWWLSKPAASWDVTLTDPATGRLVRTLTGGEARGLVGAAWDGRDTSGALVPAGAYQWTLTARPADGAGAPLVVSGRLQAVPAYTRPAYRDLAGADGVGELMTMSASGVLSIAQGSGTGGFVTAVTGAGWPTTAVAVPFGDVDRDGCNDILVRLGDELRAYRPGCGKPISPTTRFTGLGRGWAQFNVLTSPGDLTGDGHADLIVRQTTTGDILLYADNGKGTISARGRIATNWKLYRAVFAAGDLNGDRVGDLLAVDGANALWRYYGTGTGGFKARGAVFGADWAAGRNAFVGVGDLNKDGKADLLSRTTEGLLLRNYGNGAGSFGASATVSSGWQYTRALF